MEVNFIITVISGKTQEKFNFPVTADTLPSKREPVSENRLNSRSASQISPGNKPLTLIVGSVYEAEERVQKVKRAGYKNSLKEANILFRCSHQLFGASLKGIING